MSAINKTKETATYKEIITQTDAWHEAIEVVKVQANALRALWSQGAGYDSVLFTGCGSTYYLSWAAAALWIDVECARRHLEKSVCQGAKAVCRPDLAALAAADQSPLQSTHDPPSAILRALALRYRQGSAFVERDARATRTVLSEDFFCFAFRL